MSEVITWVGHLDAEHLEGPDVVTGPMAGLDVMVELVGGRFRIKTRPGRNDTAGHWSTAEDLHALSASEVGE